MRGDVRLFLSLVGVLTMLPVSAHALSLTSEDGFEFDISTTDGTMSDGTTDAYDNAYSLNLTIAGRTTRYNAGSVTHTLSLEGRQIELPEVEVGAAMARRFIYVPATGGNYARYLDIVTNPTASDLDVTINVQGNLGSDSGTVVSADSSGDSLITVDDSWFVTDDSTDMGGDTGTAHVFQSDAPRIRAASVTRSGDNFQWDFAVTIPAGESVALLSFALQNDSRAELATEAAALSEGSDDALIGLDDYTDDIINFGFAIPGAPVVRFSSVTTSPEGDDIAVMAEVTDLEGDAVSFSWDTDDDGAFGELPGATTFTISGDTTDGPGSRRVGITATDGTNSITRYRTISISNRAPEITSLADQTTTGIDAAYEYQIVAVDAAGSNDPLSYSIVQGPSGMSVSSRGLVTWTPTSANVTTEGHPIHVVIAVNDGDGDEATQEWDLQVLPNHAPTNISLLYPAEGSGVREVMPRLVVQNSYDADGETVRYQFQIDTTDTFDSPALQDSGLVEQGTGISFWYVAANLVPGTYYTWRARASDGTLNTAWRVGHFYVVPEHVDEPDMGPTADGGVDPIDMGTVVTPPPGDDGGCSVTSPGASSRGALSFLALLAVAFLLARSRKLLGLSVAVLALVATNAASAQNAPATGDNTTPAAADTSAPDTSAPTPTEAAATDSLTATQDEVDQAEAPAERRASVLDEPVDASHATTDDETRPEDSLSHRNQVGIRFGAGVGGLFAFKYASGPACGDDPTESACQRGGTGMMDLDLSFGIGDSVEITALARFGLSTNIASDTKPLIFGLGARAYANRHGIVKLFVGGRAMIDIQNSSVPNWSSVDVGARGEFGVMVDFIRWAGVYVQLGAGIQVLNGFYFLGDATGGVQARFP